MATAHAYAGLRLYTPGRTHRRVDHLPPGQVIEASWPAVVERDLWDRVQRRLSDPGRRTIKGGSARHLLSLTAVCDVCGGPETAIELPAGWRYRCTNKGCTKISLPKLDEYVEEEILTYLEREDVYRFLESADDQDDDELRHVRADLATVVSELEELQQALDAGEISAQMAGRSEARKLQRKSELEVQERELSAPAGLGPIAPGDDVRDRWEDAPLSAKRETARALLVPSVLGQVRVTREPYRGAPVGERVVWKTEENV